MLSKCFTIDLSQPWQYLRKGKGLFGIQPTQGEIFWRQLVTLFIGAGVSFLFSWWSIIIVAHAGLRFVILYPQLLMVLRIEQKVLLVLMSSVMKLQYSPSFCFLFLFCFGHRVWFLWTCFVNQADLELEEIKICLFLLSTGIKAHQYVSEHFYFVW